MQKYKAFVLTVSVPASHPSNSSSSPPYPEGFHLRSSSSSGRNKESELMLGCGSGGEWRRARARWPISVPDDAPERGGGCIDGAGCCTTFARGGSSVGCLEGAAVEFLIIVFGKGTADVAL